jgi:hypothetical protein
VAVYSQRLYRATKDLSPAAWHQFTTVLRGLPKFKQIFAYLC